MVVPFKQPAEEKPDRELQPEEMMKVLYCVLLQLRSDAVIPAAMLDSISDDQQLFEPPFYDKEKEVFIIRVHRKRERGIVTPRRKLILPGNGG